MKIISAKRYLTGALVLPMLFSGAAMALNKVYGGEQEGVDLVKPEVPRVSTEEYGTEGYVVDSDGKIVINSTGLCWRTDYWTPEMAILECDPEYVKEPEVVAEAPPPAPLPPQKISLSADALFDFDSATLKPEGIAELDQFSNDLTKVQYDMIIVIGHTDRIGSPDYNQKLSLRRAESVKEYLVVNRGIDSNLIYSDGKGEADPITGDSCQGSTSNALIACLQPDRRVDIEVTGMRQATESSESLEMPEPPATESPELQQY
jgi:OOP family OmpA-OmpF porin